MGVPNKYNTKGGVSIVPTSMSLTSPEAWFSCPVQGTEAVLGQTQALGAAVILPGPAVIPSHCHRGIVGLRWGSSFSLRCQGLKTHVGTWGSALRQEDGVGPWALLFHRRIYVEGRSLLPWGRSYLQSLLAGLFLPMAGRDLEHLQEAAAAAEYPE